MEDMNTNASMEAIERAGNGDMGHCQPLLDMGIEAEGLDVGFGGVGPRARRLQRAMRLVFCVPKSLWTLANKAVRRVGGAGSIIV
jgi:hypothetical protein